MRFKTINTHTKLRSTPDLFLRHTVLRRDTAKVNDADHAQLNGSTTSIFTVTLKVFDGLPSRLIPDTHFIQGADKTLPSVYLLLNW